MTRADLGRPTCRILDAMVWLESGRIPMPWPRSLVAFSADHLPRAGGFKGYVSELKKAELVSYKDFGLVLEHEGRELARQPESTFTRGDYWSHLDERLAVTELAVCETIRNEAGPMNYAMTRASLRDAVDGYRPTSEGDFRNALGKLLAWDLVCVARGTYSAAPSLYPLDVFERRELGRRYEKP